MYLVRDKNSFQILHTLSADLSLNLSGQQVYSAFNSETMELLKSKLGDVPDAFNVDEDGFIYAKTLQEKLLSGEVDFAQVFNAQSLDSHLDSALDPSLNCTGGLDSHEERPDLVAFVLEHNLIDTLQKSKIVFGYLVSQFEQALQAKYSQGMELKILKSYMDWQDDGKPEEDARQAKYLKMKDGVAGIKALHKPLMNRIKEVMGGVGGGGWRG
ncbi:hypothetical protein HQQ94_09520 [Shewanella sp. VB17]|uniref:hypothetical protein n=1 Tax=Shewanella sp. VB17 TaxID=2739432 RepID=UPI0015666FC8|nr:hypothetical protein [Shewanella sp. VB17]NRD73479.1 hypothetical protein [Shewanella sp. VB17]